MDLMCSRASTGLPGRSVSHTAFYRYHYSFGNFRHWFFYVVSFSWGCWSPPSFKRIVFRSLLWFASLGLSSGHGHSHRTHSHFSQSRRLTFGSRLASIFIPRSLAAFYVPPSHLYISIYFLSSMCQYRRLISSLHAFTTSHHASYFGSRDIGLYKKRVDEAIYIKNKSSDQASAPCVYDDPAVLQVARHIHLQAQLSACLFMRGVACRASFFFTFLCSWILGLVIFPLSPLLPLLLPSPICHTFLGSWFLNFLFPMSF